MKPSKRKMKFLKWMKRIKNNYYADTERMDRALDNLVKNKV